MQYRALGASGIQASVVSLGTWAIGGWMWGGTSEKEAIACIQRSIDEGMSFIDTAPIYGFGVSEEIVGKAMRGRRDKVVLATKCGLVWDRQGGDFFFNSDEKSPRSDASEHAVYRYLGPAAIRAEVEASLKRLGTDVIDLYQTHWQESKTPIADTMAELLKLKAEGKIRAIGVSNATAEQMDQYRAVGPVDADQERYSMLDRRFEQSNLPYCAKHNLAFLAYSPLEQGLLTGAIGPDRQFAEGDQRRNSPRFSVESRTKIAELLKAFAPIAKAHRATLSQLTIAWTVHQPGCSHALVGARTPEQAVENAKAGDIRLTSAELKAMAEAIARHTPA